VIQVNALRTLKELLPKGAVFTDRASLLAYEADAGLDRGLADGIVLPGNAEEVERVVRWAKQHGVPLVARGAGTGLSGGAVAEHGGVIVAFARMNRVLEIDAYGRRATAEPATINVRLDEQVKAHKLYFPPDPASQRASTLGGNVAENSGGPHCFKYGVTTNYVVGMEVVLADGQRIRVGGPALDYPEYDLCGLLTGSEGMFALMTSISVRLLRNPLAVKTLLAIFNSIEQASNAVSAIIAAGLVPATMELMDQKIIGIAEPFAQAGLPLDAGAILILEVDGYPQSLDVQAEEIVSLARTYGAYDVRVAHSEEERARIWLARKSVAGAVTRLAPAYYTVDVTVPRSRLAQVLAKVDAICERYQIRTGYLAHAGDGNLHPMMLIPDPDDAQQLQRVHDAGREMVKLCVEMGGSLTGEHGVGIEKRDYMPLMHTPAELRAMQEVKLAFDPTNLLNPGKVFPAAEVANEAVVGTAVARPGHGRATAVPTTVEPVASGGPIAPIGDEFVPASAAEAAQGLAVLAQEGRRVAIQHALVPAADVRLSTAALSGIATLALDDLYVTVGAGTPLLELQDFLAQYGKMVPLASPWPDATVGGLIAANRNVPLRMRYGAIRDLVLCGTAALADGRIIRLGRPIVKNVAGYDLMRAFVGSHGTLGLLTDVTLKLFARPRKRITLSYRVHDLHAALSWAQRMLPLALIASGITLSKGQDALQPSLQAPPPSYLLTYTAEGIAEDVVAELAQVRQVLQEQGAPAPFEDEAGISATDRWCAMPAVSAGGATTVCVGVPTRELPRYIAQHASLLNAGSFIADMSSGILHAFLPYERAEEASAGVAALRAAALAAQGYAVVLEMPTAFVSNIERWGYVPQGLTIMQRLKQQWDPSGILNPGVFVV
jgi:glycolate oxidase subunit GlcD